MEGKVVKFPLLKEELTIDEALSIVETDEGIADGMIIAFRNDSDGYFIVNFGDMNRMKALWLAEQLRDYALYDASEDEIS